MEAVTLDAKGIRAFCVECSARARILRFEVAMDVSWSFNSDETYVMSVEDTNQQMFDGNQFERVQDPIEEEDVFILQSGPKGIDVRDYWVCQA